MKTLTPAQRQHLRSLAHARQPVVMIGNQGLTASVVKEIEQSLKAHELIKVKAGSGDLATRRGWMDEICAATGAVPVQMIGKILVVYRRAEPAVIALPS